MTATVSRISVNDSGPVARVLQTLGEPNLAGSASVTLPVAATAHALGALFASTTVAASVVPLGFTVSREASGLFSLERVRIDMPVDSGFLGMPLILKLYETAPTSAAGDAGAWLSNTTFSSYVGDVSVVMDQSFSNGLAGVGVPTKSDRIMIQCDAASKFYGFLVAGAAITPSAGSRTINVRVEGYAL